MIYICIFTESGTVTELTVPKEQEARVLQMYPSSEGYAHLIEEL